MPTSRVAEFPTPGPGLARGERPVQQEARTFTPLVSAFTIGLDMPGRPSRELGTKEHKKRYPRGEEIWCQLFCAPGGSCDAASSSPPSAAVANRQKVWTPGTRRSDVGAIIARRRIRASTAVPHSTNCPRARRPVVRAGRRRQCWPQDGLASTA